MAAMDEFYSEHTYVFRAEAYRCHLNAHRNKDDVFVHRRDSESLAFCSTVSSAKSNYVDPGHHSKHSPFPRIIVKARPDPSDPKNIDFTCRCPCGCKAARL